jgi:hypothetical protein
MDKSLIINNMSISELPVKKSLLITEELTKIYEKNGQLTPQMVVDAARPKKAPLHKFFEWRDKIAAEEHRLAQARYLIRTVITVVTDADKLFTVRKFINIRTEEENGDTFSAWGRFSKYVTVEDCISDEVYKKIMLESALSELRAFRLKYANLKQIAKIVREIDNFLENF